MYKLLKYNIVDNEVSIDLEIKNIDNFYNTEMAFEFLGDKYTKLKRELAKIIRKKNLRFRKGKVNLFINGTLLLTILLSTSCSINEDIIIPEEITAQNIIIEEIEEQDEEENIGAEVEKKEEEEKEAIVLKQMDLILIAGHNALIEPGAVSNGRYESIYALELVNLVKEELSKKGNINIRLILEPKGMSVSDEMSFISSTKSDYILSIHFNAGGGSGTEIIVPHFQTDLTLASEIINNFKEFKQPIRSNAIYSRSGNTYTSRTSGVKVPVLTDYYGVIRAGSQKSVPSDIIEVEFIDNEKNMQFYDNHKQKYAKGIADAIEVYYLNCFIE